MQAKELLFVTFICGFVFVSSPAVVSAYDNLTTHPALTQGVIDFYNNGGNSITAEEKEWIVQGSVEEDMPPRWLNHFYDPISGQGWTGESTGELPSGFVLAFSNLFLAPTDPVSAVRWVNDGLTQLVYANYGGDQTWKRGLKYFADGDKKDAYITLGHTLHLLEDMVVPEHTRDDTHVDLAGVAGEYGSPYEAYATKWTRATIGDLHIVDTLQSENAVPSAKTSIEDYLISLAQYSNRYFFSKDTINSPKYSLPKIVRSDESFGYGVDENMKEFPLVRARTFFNEQGEKQTDYSLKDKNDAQIFDAYFSHLARQAVLNGAGAIALFQKQARDAVVNKGYHMTGVNEDVVSFFSSGFSLYGEAVKLANAVETFITDAFSAVGDLFQKSGALIAYSVNSVIGPEEIDIVGVNAEQGIAATFAPSVTPNLLPVVVFSTTATSVSQQAPGLSESSNVEAALRKKLLLALDNFTLLLNEKLAALAAVSVDQAVFAPPAEFALSNGGGASLSPQAATGAVAASSWADNSTTALFTAGPTSTEAAAGAPPEETGAPPGETGAPAGDENTTTTLFSQPVDSAISHWSWYSNNWYELGSGFAGTLRTITLRGYIDNSYFSTSHLWFDEFKDPAYSYLVRTITISDNAPFTAEMSTTTIDGLSVTLKPYFYYRLGTRQDYQNRSVILAGSDATGTAMWNNYRWGVGIVTNLYAFMPFMVGEGLAATSTVPPPLTPPGNLTFNFDAFNLQLTFTWSSSTDPDWPGNPLRYEINYSTSSELKADNWQSVGQNLSASIPVTFPYAYVISVRALDDFGAVSSGTAAAWNFPADFRPPIESLDHTQAIGGAGDGSGGQKIFVPTTTVIDGVAMWLEFPGAVVSCCNSSYLGIYTDDNGVMGTSLAASEHLVVLTCGGGVCFTRGPEEYQYDLASPVTLLAGNYYWLVPIKDPNNDRNGSTLIYGSAGDVYPDGYWSSNSSTDAYFRLRPAAE